jgi:hypothetical protein
MAHRSPRVAQHTTPLGQESVKAPSRRTALVIDGPGVIDTLAEVEAAIAARERIAAKTHSTKS